MVAITKASKASPASSPLRQFDVRRDLNAVADLVELCFADTLDVDGREYVSRMRQSAQSTPFLRWAAATAEWSSAPFAGYVWQHDGAVVGNASLIPFFVKGQRYFLIANVAVHPDFRRQGIARQLTEQAIAYARKKGAPAVWLHVHRPNEVALQLYRSLGFAERFVRTSWLSQPDHLQGKAPAGVRFASPRSAHWAIYRPWLERSYPAELSWHMPFRLDNQRPDLLGGFYRLLFNVYVQQWCLLRGDQLLGCLAWQALPARFNALWLAAPANGDEDSIQALLLHARRRAPTSRPLLLDYPADQYAGAIQAAGFKAQHTLVWMSLSFSEKQ
jgi:ribosomal protein S18 acetylase RimI-like enzyme